MSAKELASAFIAALNKGDAAAAMALVDPAVTVDIVPAKITGTGAEHLRSFVDSAVQAFPDLVIHVRSMMGTPEFATIELKFEGTQAADFLGVINQEKHVDVDQAWMFWAAAGKLTKVRAYWCQNQLYRRLAVKRLDRVSILG